MPVPEALGKADRGAGAHQCDGDFIPMAIPIGSAWTSPGAKRAFHELGRRITRSAYSLATSPMAQRTSWHDRPLRRGSLSDGCDDDVMQDSCEEPDLQDERCADVDDVQTLTALVEASCGRNDSTHVLAKVQALGEGPYSCSPYTLSFTSRVIEDD